MRISNMAAFSMLVLFGCGGGETEPPPTQGGAEQEPTTGSEMEEMGEAEGADAMSAMCPTQVQGTTVQAENVEGGAALVFVTTGDVNELRERVRHFAAMQEAHAMRSSGSMGMDPAQRAPAPGGDVAGAKTADPMAGETQGGTQGTMGGSPEGVEGKAMPQVNTRVEDVEGGARLVMIPMDSADLESVRMNVEQQAQAMTSGQCQMMMPHSHSGMPPAGPQGGAMGQEQPPAGQGAQTPMPPQ